MRIFVSFLFSLILCATSSNLAIGDVAKSQWVNFSGENKIQLRGLLYQPEMSDGFLPAIVLLHDCFGLRDHQKNWARSLAEKGYVALLVDSFTPRRLKNTCASRPGAVYADSQAAKSYLETLKGIDHDRIGLIAWGADISLDPAPTSTQFAATVAFYPECNFAPGTKPGSPLLLLMGADDGWTPPGKCLELAKTQRVESPPVRIHIYQNTVHGFDDSGLDARQKVQGVHISYNRLAHEDAKTRIDNFLNQHLQLTLAKAYPSKAYSPLPLHEDHDLTPAVNRALGTWVIDPSATGPNIPPVGRSVFDRLFTSLKDGKATYAIPFPYTDLVDQLTARLKPGRSGGAPIKQVLIPKGRSLQREAAAPDYFDNPRVVAAVDGEPDTEAPFEAVLFKDRLFLGYVGQTNLLEVISYNEAAMRFEFQIVKNYARGKKPEVYYADRRLCTSCHQNKSPLFSRENWTETNTSASPVGQNLRKHAESFHGITVHRSGEVPAKIDLSTDRANLFSVLQKLWRDGCGADVGTVAVQCRAAGYLAMLQFQLSNSNNFDRDDPEYAKRFEAVITENWRRLWPGGLFVPNSDIPDRDPLGATRSISGARDPLTKRSPMEVWSGFRRSDPERLITGFSEQFTVHDIRKLDQALMQRSGSAIKQELQARCSVKFNPQRGLEHPLLVDCSGSDKQGSFTLVGEINLPGRKNATGKLRSMAYRGRAIGDRVRLRASKSSKSNRLTFSLARQGLSARLPNALRIASVSFTALDKNANPTARFTRSTSLASVSIRVIDDFAQVRSAVGNMADASIRNGRGIFAMTPFHGPKSMSSLFQTLGIKSTKWCCAADKPAPPLKLDDVRPFSTVDEEIHAKALRLMVDTCGACHRNDNPFPPNFLYGSPAQVLAGTTACAPRILHRLALWDTPEEQRDQTAMPPVSQLHARGLTALSWRQSPELKRIRKFVSNLKTDPRGINLGCQKMLELVRKAE